MKTLSNTQKESANMQALLEEANQILKETTDLNKEKKRLGNLLEEMMYWSNEENQYYEEYYRQFSDMIKAMFTLDFSKTLSTGTPKSFMNFLAVGLNLLNEDLKTKVLPVKMIHSLLEALDLKKDTVLLITDAEGVITFIHTTIHEPYFSEEALLGQNLVILFQENFQTIENFLKKEGTLKSMKVNMAYNKIGPVTIRLAMPSMINSFSGIAYVITIPEKN